MLYDAERGDISIAVVGDAMLSRRLQAFREPHFLKLVDLIRETEVSIANLEFLFHDYEYSWQWTHGTYTRSDPKNLKELKWMGVDGVFRFPADPVFWQSVVAVCHYKSSVLKEVKLYPIDMGFGRPIPQRGRPVLAEEQVAHNILTWLQTVSEPFGTQIVIDGTVGTIHL
jgi:hypothetical protein